MKSNLNLSLIIFSVFLFGFTLSETRVIKTKSREYNKAVRKKTKELEKKGYVAKGSGTVELYVKKAINIEFDTDDKGQSKNSVVYTSALDPTYEGAITACRASAKAALAGNIETTVAELVKRSLNSNQISMKSAEGINQVITSGKQLIAQKVSMEDIYTLYREVPDERSGMTIIEVEYSGYYSKKLAMQKAMEYAQQQLKEENEDLHNSLDKIFEF